MKFLGFLLIFGGIISVANADSSAINSNLVASKIAIIDAKKVQEEALVMKDLDGKISLEANKLQRSIAEKENEIKEKVSKMEKSDGVVSNAKIAEKQKQIQQEIADFQEDLRIRQMAIESARNDALAGVDKVAKDAVTDVAKKQKLSLVLSSQAVLYYSKDEIADVTEDFIENLDKSIKASNFDEYYKKAYKNGKKKKN